MKFAATFALVVGVAACAHPQKNPVCTQLACQSGLRVGFRPASGVWPKGKYRFQVIADDSSTMCESDLPLPKAATKPSCPVDYALLEESGALLPAREQAYGGIQILRAAAKITIRVSRDGRELVQGTWSPAYRQVEPNGPGCPPTCKQGEDAEMVVP